MTRINEEGLPKSNFHGALDSVIAMGYNNHIQRVSIDTHNPYGIRVVINRSSEHDFIVGKPDNEDATHWYSVRDRKGDVTVAEMEPPSPEDMERYQFVWEPTPTLD